MSQKTPEVGVQDPELKNSPIAWEGDEETETLREGADQEPECFFNSQTFAHGAAVTSGGTPLVCDGGIWIPAARTVAEEH